MELLPPEQRDAKGRFCPDLCAATPTGTVVYIEVETGHTGRAIAEGARKWEVIADHCGGQVRAVCASEAALRQGKSEVTFLSRRYAGRLDVKAGVYDAMAKAAGSGATLDDLWTWRRARDEEGDDGD